MKKKIFIMSHAMELGGAETSLIGLLDSFDYSKYSVDLFLLRHEGELLNFVPSNVNILPSVPSYSTLGKSLISNLKQGHILLFLCRLYGKFAAKLYGKLHHMTDCLAGIEYSHKYTKWAMPKIMPDREYDVAISFLTPHYFVTEKVKAKKKIAWIHTDYTNMQIDFSSEEKMWESYDNIVAISQKAKESFEITFPNLAGKVNVIENIISKKFLEKRINELDMGTNLSSDESTVLLSIGRITYQKNFDNIPDICSRLLSKGINFKWYIIGDGIDRHFVEEKIKQFKLEDTVILLGKKENPYPYIKACDIYIQPSRYEGKCVAVREAQMLSKPVIITNYSTSSSQLEDGVDGIIVPLDNELCAEEIANVIKNKDLQTKLIENCKARDYSNANEIEKLYKLLNG